jgi:hypothetical protein
VLVAPRAENASVIVVVPTVAGAWVVADLAVVAALPAEHGPPLL